MFFDTLKNCHPFDNQNLQHPSFYKMDVFIVKRQFYVFFTSFKASLKKKVFSEIYSFRPWFLLILLQKFGKKNSISVFWWQKWQKTQKEIWTKLKKRVNDSKIDINRKYTIWICCKSNIWRNYKNNCMGFQYFKIDLDWFWPPKPKGVNFFRSFFGQKYGNIIVKKNKFLKRLFWFKLALTGVKHT